MRTGDNLAVRMVPTKSRDDENTVSVYRYTTCLPRSYEMTPQRYHNMSLYHSAIYSCDETIITRLWDACMRFASCKISHFVRVFLEGRAGGRRKLLIQPKNMVLGGGINFVFGFVQKTIPPPPKKTTSNFYFSFFLFFFWGGGDSFLSCVSVSHAF